MPAGEQRGFQFHQNIFGQGIHAQRGPDADQRPGGEGFRLTLAVDGGVGDNGHRFLVEVRHVDPILAQHGQRPVMAQRTYRILTIDGQGLDFTDLFLCPACGGQDNCVYRACIRLVPGQVGRGFAQGYPGLPGWGRRCGDGGSCGGSWLGATQE